MKDLVFLHGGAHGSWCWRLLFAELSKTPKDFSRLIALDMPGCGVKRGKETKSETLQSLTKSLNDELRAANVGKAALIGHSIAGVVMPLMAAEDPSLYSDLVFMQTSAPKEGQSIIQMMGSTLHGEDPEEVGWPVRPDAPAQERISAMFGPDLTREQVHWILSESRQDVTPEAVTFAPVTRAGYEPSRFHTAYVLAQRDPILPIDWQRRFAERLGCRRILEIDTPHEAFISHPALLARTLREILD